MPVSWYIVLGLFLPCAARSSAPERPCDPGWQYFDFSCYKAGNEAMEYFDAERFCARENAHLASLHSKEEQSFVTTKVSKSPNHLLWIGYTKTGNNWKWTDGSNPTDFINWDKGLGPQPENDKCTATNKDRSYRWHDINCGRHSHYVCKKHSNVAPVLRCETGWQLYGSSCYKAGTSAREYFDAESMCVRQDAHLASIHSKEEESFVMTKVSKSPDHLLWIGFTRIGNHWEWTDGSDPTDFIHWVKSSTQPHPDYDCTTTHKYRDSQWHSINCTRHAHYVCKKHANVPVLRCEPGWQLYGSSCYKVEDTLEYWPDAQRKCKEMGANLASIHSKAENEFVTKLSPMFGTVNMHLHRDYLWIGVNTDTTRKVWRNADGTDLDYVYWATGEPNNDGGNENCVHLYPQTCETDGKTCGRQYSWNDLNCTLHRMRYVCKKPVRVTTTTPKTRTTTTTTKPTTTATLPRATATSTTRTATTTKTTTTRRTTKTTTTTTTTTPRPVLKCENGWKLYKSSCYKGSTVKKTFIAAEDDCLAKGAHVVSINSPTEQEFVKAFLPDRVWLGLKKDWKKNIWNWKDGTALGWSKLEDKSMNGPCALMRHPNYQSTWVAVGCLPREEFYVCEKPAK